MTGKYNQGLTLVEVLVALAILGLLSILAYRALDATLQVRGRVAVEAGRWRELSFFFDRLREDIDQPATRGPRTADGARLQAWSGSAAALEFAVIGHGGNPLRHVKYRLHAGVVELLLWPVFDAAPADVPETHALVQGVRSLRFGYLNRSRTWVETWPPQGAGNEAPLGIRIDISMADGTRVSRIFAVP
jgi:general secretion pathway protein J